MTTEMPDPMTKADLKEAWFNSPPDAYDQYPEYRGSAWQYAGEVETCGRVSMICCEVMYEDEHVEENEVLLVPDKSFTMEHIEREELIRCKILIGQCKKCGCVWWANYVEEVFDKPY